MFKKVFTFFLSYLFAMIYSQTLLLLWFLQNGVSYLQMLFYYLVIYVSALLIYFVLRNFTFSSRISLLIGVASSGLGVLVANFMTKPFHIYFAAILFGLNIVFFWTIYNVLHFKYSKSNENGLKSGAYYLFSPIFAVVLSPLTGLIVEKFGYHFLFITSMFIYIVPLYLSFSIPNFNFKFNILKSAQIIENKLLITFQGYISMLTYNVVPIFTLFYIQTPVKLGNFFGYIAVLSTIVAFLNSKFSDKKLKFRSFFFYLFITLSSISFIPLAFVNSLLGWQIFSGISNFTDKLANPFNLALIMDYAKSDMIDTMLGREFYLNLGRIIMIMVALIVFLFTNSLKSALLISVLISLLYPILAYYKKIYLK